MKTTLVCTRKYNKEEYKFFLNEPDYAGELGVCGIEIEPYVSVETPENGFGYSDTVLMNNGKAYTPFSVINKRTVFMSFSRNSGVFSIFLCPIKQQTFPSIFLP